MRPLAKTAPRGVSKLLVFSTLGVVCVFGVGCKLLNPDGAAAEEYDGDYVPLLDDGAGPSQFENATDAIMAARSTPASPAVAALEERFKAGDYEASLAAARDLVASAGENDDERDAAVFVEGASLYYLGRHDEAQRPLESHRQEFPDSRYGESSMYYVASNLVKQARWQAGANALDAFIRQFPESLLMEFALYDRATVNYALGDYQSCFADAERIDREFPYSKIRDRSGVLKGDVLRRQGQLEQAEAAFLSAKNLAESFGHPRVAARALRNLIEVSAEGGRYEDSVAYYQTFFQKYPESSQAPAAALGGLPALKATGDLEAGLDRMENVLLTMPEDTAPRTLNKALRTYASYFRELHGPEELLKRYGNLSSTGRGSEALREQLIIARLEVLEDYFPERSSEIRVFYEEFRARFSRRELSTPTVLKIGRHLVAEEPGEAAAWFREVLARPGSELKAEATFGLAQCDAALGAREEAERGFRKVLEQFGTPALAEEATLGLGRSLGAQSRWAEARDVWARYLANENWTVARAEAERGLELAKAQAGGAPAESAIDLAPAPVDPSPAGQAQRPAENRFAQKLAQAERLIEKGMKPQAFEVLKSVVQAGESIEEPDRETERVLRRAAILEEDLELELGSG